METREKESILIIEDEEDIAEGLQELFRTNQYQVSVSSCLLAAREQMKEKIFSVYLLDVVLPDGDSFALCQEIREKTEAPILFLTAMDDEDSVIRGLDSGGDDYVTKPFRTRELLSRVEANLKRYRKISSGAATPDQGKQLRFGELLFDASAGRLYRQGELIPLKKIEYRLLELFMENAGILLTRELLLQKLWDAQGEFVEDNTLSVEVSRLRRKIGNYQGKSYIETIRGIGYRFHTMEGE